MKKSVVLIAIWFLFLQAVSAQEKSKPEVISEKVMSAAFQSLDESSPIKLSDYKGKIIVVALWAEWCAPCRMAAVSLNDFHKDFACRGVEVIGLSIDNPKSNAENVHAFVRDSRLKYKLGWANEEMAKEFLGDKASVPQILILTDEGIVIKRFVGFIPNKMKEHLSEAVERAFINLPTKQ